jgi:hypothetical protein
MMMVELLVLVVGIQWIVIWKHGAAIDKIQNKLYDMETNSKAGRF